MSITAGKTIPWYRQGWPWFLILLPATVVVACFITLYLARQGKLSYWPEAWCRSFKRHCLQPGLMGWFKPPTIPQGARLIAFHGKPNPPDAIAGVSGKWYRRVMPTQWVADHWR